MNQKKEIGFEFGIRCSKCHANLPNTYKITLELNSDGDIKITSDGRHKAETDWNERVV